MNINKFLHKFRQIKPKDIAAFIAWTHEHAAKIEQLDELNIDIEKFSFLDKLLENKRVVYLGEEDHWIHEKSDYRLLMLRYLISRGWRYIGEELGWSDGIRIDRYLENGGESQLDQIATYGYSGALRTDRDDKATGILKGLDENYPVTEFKSEQLRLTRSLRYINKNYLSNSDRMHFFGFDIDAMAGGGYEDIEGLLNPLKDKLAVIKILTLLKRVHGETLEDEINRLVRTLETIKLLEIDLKYLLGKKQYIELQEWIMTLHDSFEFNRIANPATKYKSLNIAMAAREEVMYRHVKFVLSQMKPKDKLVLMGHNRHLSKNIDIIKNVGAAPPGGKRVPSIGTYINRLLPGQVFSIWEMHDHGSSSKLNSMFSNEYISVPGSLNSILAEVGSNYLVPTAGAALFMKNMDVVGIYNAIYTTVIAKQADAIFFIRKVSPLRS